MDRDNQGSEAVSKLDERWDANKPDLAEAAQTAGIDVSIMAKIAGFESGYNPSARPISSNASQNKVRQFDGIMALSSAHGYGQFLNGTWKDMINKYGEKYGVANAAEMTKQQANVAELRNDKKLQASMLAEFTRENIEKGARLGGADADANVYAFHNLGNGDATKLLNAYRDNPDQRVDELLSGRVIAGNPALYGDGTRTVDEAYQAMGQAMDKYEKYALDAVDLPSKIMTAPLDSQQSASGLQQGTVTFGTPMADGLPDFLRVTNPLRRQARFSDAMSDGVLHHGDRGPAVSALQENLRHLGATNSKRGPLESDGRYGNDTKGGVERFQLWSGRNITGTADRATFDAIKMQADLAISQRAVDEVAGLPIKDFADNVSLGVKLDPRDMADLAVPNPQKNAFADPSVPERVRAPEPREQAEPTHQPTPVGSSPSIGPVAVTPTADFLRDFRGAHHPQHVRYEQTLAAVHAMEDRRNIPHGPNSERVAAAFVDHMHKEGFQELARLELRGDGVDTRIVAVQIQHTPWTATNTLALEPNQTMARSVEQSSAAWAERALPHLQLPATPVEAQTPSRSESERFEHDLRNPQCPGHSLYANVRGQVASAYAAAGLPRTQEQLAQATAAVALNMRRDLMTHAEAVLLTPDPKTGVIGANSPLVALQGEHDDPLKHRVVTTPQDLQRPVEQSFQQMSHATQQRVDEPTLAQQPRDERSQQRGNGIVMG